MAFWVAVVGAAIAVAAAGYGTYVSVEQYNQQVEVAEAEGKARQTEAENLRHAAEYEERQQRRRTALLLGQQESIIAGTGLDPGSGSPLTLELDTIRQAEMEALQIRRTGTVGASAKDFEAKLAKFRADVARGNVGKSIVGGTFQAASAVLNAYSSYQAYQARYGRVPTTTTTGYGGE